MERLVLLVACSMLELVFLLWYGDRGGPMTVAECWLRAWTLLDAVSTHRLGESDLLSWLTSSEVNL
jgi:hypothetical protein